MDVTVSEDTLKRTTRCKRNFACLSGKPEDLCEVDYRQGKFLLWMKTRKHPFCDYCIEYASSSVSCVCPTRLELYKRYGI